MSRRDLLYLEDIIEACEKIQEYVQGYSYETFLADSKTRDAVARNLQIIGEAARRLSPELKDAHSEVEWNRIAGLRNRIVHEYSGIDWQIVWDVIVARLPELRDQAEMILRTEFGEEG